MASLPMAGEFYASPHWLTPSRMLKLMPCKPSMPSMHNYPPSNTSSCLEDVEQQPFAMYAALSADGLNAGLWPCRKWRRLALKRSSM